MSELNDLDNAVFLGYLTDIESAVNRIKWVIKTKDIKRAGVIPGMHEIEKQSKILHLRSKDISDFLRS